MKSINDGLGSPENCSRSQIMMTAALAAAVLCYSLYCAFRFGTARTDFSPDETAYIDMARRLIDTHVFSFWGNGADAYVTPGYPLLLAGFMALFGTGANGLFAVQLAQALMLSEMVYLTVILGSRLTGRFAVGMIAGILTAGNFTFQYFANHFLTEVPYCFFMMLFFTVLLEAMQRERLRLHFVSGVLFAVAVLIRPLIFVTLPFYYLPMLIRSRCRAWRAPLCFLLGALSLLVPWWIRNLVVLHRFVLFATQTNPFFAGIAEDPYGMGHDDPKTIFGNLRLLWAFLCTRPVETLRWMTFEKFNIIFSNAFGSYHAQAINAFVQKLTVYVGLCGSLCALFRKRLRPATSIFWIYFVSTFLFVPDARYALQYTPLLAIAAGYLIVSGIE